MDFQNNRELHHNNETPTNLWIEYGKLCTVYASNARKSHGCKFGVNLKVVFIEFHLIGKDEVCVKFMTMHGIRNAQVSLVRNGVILEVFITHCKIV